MLIQDSINWGYEMGLYYLPSVGSYIDDDTGLVMPARLSKNWNQDNFMIQDCPSEWYHELNSSEKRRVDLIAPSNLIKKMNDQ